MNGQQPTFQVPPAKFQPAPPQPIKPNKLRLTILILILIVALGGGAAYYFLVYTQGDANKNTNLIVSTRNVNTTVNTNKSTNVSSVSNINSQNVNSNSNTNSLSNTNQPDSQTDTDGDGIPDNIESFFGTGANKNDTDSDSYNDYEEIAGCYNPLGGGRIGRDVFTIYCPYFIAGDEASVETLCNEWASISDKVINTRVAGMTEEEAITEVKTDQEYQTLCQSSIDNGYGEGFCQAMLELSYGMCDIFDWLPPENVIPDS